MVSLFRFFFFKSFCSLKRFNFSNQTKKVALDAFVLFWYSNVFIRKCVLLWYNCKMTLDSSKSQLENLKKINSNRKLWYFPIYNSLGKFIRKKLFPIKKSMSLYEGVLLYHTSKVKQLTNILKKCLYLCGVKTIIVIIF